MARNILKLAHTDAKTHRVRSAKTLDDRNWEETSDESTTKNRIVYYDVDCKACNTAYTKSKSALLKTHTCPKCFSAQEATVPSKVSKTKPEVALFLSDLNFVVLKVNPENAADNLSESDRALWNAHGRKVAVSDGLGRFTVQGSAKHLSTSTRTTNPAPKPAPINLLDSPAPEPLAKPIQKPSFEKAVDRATASTPLTLRTPEEDRGTVEAEGYHSDLRRKTEFCKLAPHSPNRRTFQGWLISQENLENLKNNRPAYTTNQRRVRDEGETDTPNEFDGAPLENLAEALKATPEFTGWSYIYKYAEGFDPNKHIYKVPCKNVKGVFVTGSIDECYQIWLAENASNVVKEAQ